MGSGVSFQENNTTAGKQHKNDDFTRKTLLYLKKLLAFLRGFIGFLAILSLFLSIHPVEAKACSFRDITSCFTYFFGGSEPTKTETAFIGDASATISPDPVLEAPSTANTRQSPMSDANLGITERKSLVATRNPQGFVSDGIGGPDDQIFVYEVQWGDTAQSIANSYGITVNTLLWANDLSNPNRIKVGSRLVILPVTGFTYDIKKGDTIDKIVKKYLTNKSAYSAEDMAQMEYDILAYNGLALDPKDPLTPGDTIIIPNTEGDFSQPELPVSPVSLPSPAKTSYSGLPDIKGFFMMPITRGRRSRGFHGNNGVDLVNSDASGSSCGRPIFAAAEGNVIFAKSFQWNGGYGNYVIISHPNGVKTLYAHMKQVFVSVGQEVTQGQQIGLIGTTGNSTGCHVHFEVRGAKNPF